LTSQSSVDNPLGVGNGRDAAVVLSGGAINGVLMEVGFLKRLRESPLWERVGWIFGTSAGALAGTMAALDRLDELEEFLLGLRPDEVFRPNRLWRLPLLGLHEYALPQTISQRIGDLGALAEELAHAERELVVFASDVTETERPTEHNFELAYSSRTTPPDVMAQAILASAAISTLVLPLRVGDRIATDGAWTRNFPLGYAYDRPEVELIIAFRYVASYPRMGAAPLQRLQRRLRPFRRVPPVRALIAELEEAEARDARGEPAHYVDMITRLMRLSVLRGTDLEEQQADATDRSIRELELLTSDLRALVREHGGSEELERAVEERLAAADFPFRRERALPRITVRAGAEGATLEARIRRGAEWTDEAKRTLIQRGYELTDEELSRAVPASVEAPVDAP
jgi:predicted acylesterase/phospholipase RssA